MSQYIRQKDLNEMFTQFQQDMYKNINNCVELKSTPLYVLFKSNRKSNDSAHQQIYERLNQLEQEIETLKTFKNEQIEKVLNHEAQLEKHSNMFKDVPNQCNILMKVLGILFIISLILGILNCFINIF